MCHWKGSQHTARDMYLLSNIWEKRNRQRGGENSGLVSAETGAEEEDRCQTQIQLKHGEMDGTNALMRYWRENNDQINGTK